eukprot:jgi/Tetstr1/433040/TSEL_022377.t1
MAGSRADTELGIQLRHKSTTLVIRRGGGDYLIGSTPTFLGGVVAGMLRGLRHVRVGPRALARLVAASLSSVRSLLNRPWRIDACDGCNAGFSSRDKARTSWASSSPCSLASSTPSSTPSSAASHAPCAVWWLDLQSGNAVRSSVRRVLARHAYDALLEAQPNIRIVECPPEIQLAALTVPSELIAVTGNPIVARRNAF